MVQHENQMAKCHAVRDFDSFNGTIVSIRKRGYTVAFRREATFLTSDELQISIMPGNFKVDTSSYFQQPENADASRMLYAISSYSGIKGFLVEPCRVFDDTISIDLSQKLISGDL